MSVAQWLSSVKYISRLLARSHDFTDQDSKLTLRTYPHRRHPNTSNLNQVKHPRPMTPKHPTQSKQKPNHHPSINPSTLPTRNSTTASGPLSTCKPCGIAKVLTAGLTSLAREKMNSLCSGVHIEAVNYGGVRRVVCLGKTLFCETKDKGFWAWGIYYDVWVVLLDY